MEEEEEEEVMPHQPCIQEQNEYTSPSLYSRSMTYPICSWSKIKRRSPLKIKKRLVPKTPSSLKSKSKLVVSCDSGKSRRRKRTRIDDLYNNVEAKFSVMERAEGALANLAEEFPSFVKCMLPSNVSYGFWLILPKKFCNLHLPMHDTTVTLVDDCGQEYKTNYLVERHGLSAGWRGFSIAHRLLKGDRLIFYLVEPCKLKVNIVRVYGIDEVDAALCLMNIVSCEKRTYSNKNTRTRKNAKKCLKSFLLDKPQENIQIDSPMILNSKLGLGAVQYESNSDDFGSEVLEGSETSDYLQSNELCCGQNTFLYDYHLMDMNCGSAAARVS